MFNANIGNLVSDFLGSAVLLNLSINFGTAIKYILMLAIIPVIAKLNGERSENI
jgi:hypothetical protein